MTKEHERGLDYFNNPNGYLTIEEMIKLKKESKIDEYMRNFKPSLNKCPNEDILHRDEIGSYFYYFYCISCFKAAFDKIKEYKNYYKVFGQKYEK